MFTQTGTDSRSSHSVLHIRDAVHRLWTSVEPGRDATRGYLQKDLVAKLPLHPQLLRIRKHGILLYTILR